MASYKGFEFKEETYGSFCSGGTYKEFYCEELNICASNEEEMEERINKYIEENPTEFHMDSKEFHGSFFSKDARFVSAVWRGDKCYALYSRKTDMLNQNILVY